MVNKAVQKTDESSLVLSTGLSRCFNENGDVIECSGSGQDGEFQNRNRFSRERFEPCSDHLLLDKATGLIWTKNSCLTEFPLSWQEGLEFVEQMNVEKRYGRNDWRMPNRREMRSLIDHSSKKPALPLGHPFQNIFLGWYWTSTTAAIATRYAWYVHLEGGRMFYGNKDGYCWVWPVCGESDRLLSTGAKHCYDEQGCRISCETSRQDGSLMKGVPWAVPRFLRVKIGILDVLTNLIWHSRATFGHHITSWSEALDTVDTYAKESKLPWRMPNINELESLVDAATHSPALPVDHPFSDVKQAYWSSTTSTFEPDWAYVMYLAKGAVGVGFKKNRDFSLWPVMAANMEKQGSPDFYSYFEERG